MPVNEALLALQVAQGLANVGMGIYDRSQGKKMLRDLKDPIATIPQSSTEALMRAKTLASSNRLPGQTGIEQKLDAGLAGTTAGAMRAGTDSGSILQAIVGANARRNDSQVDLGIAGAENRFRNEQGVTNQLGRLAEEEKRVFDINVMQPFQRKLSSAFSTIGNGNQLISGGSGQTTGAISGYAANKQLEDYIKSMREGKLGNTGGPPNSNTFIPSFGGDGIYTEYGADENGYVPDEMYTK